MGLGREAGFSLSFQWVRILSCPAVQSFSHEFGDLCEIHELWETCRFCDRCSGTGCESVIRWWENCIVYSLFCIFIIISIYFVVLLNCLYLSPRVLPSVHSPPHPAGGEGEGRASGCLVLSCRLGLNDNRCL